ncbi:Glycine cleavage system H protein [hydrothermal vent metagenome]|uniref:Glycine cleavage system H protein n=1 Tax=hydrothermal vent metagenome TaxID=652676 RepID=A0A3B0TJJ7_9ZZZZ
MDYPQDLRYAENHEWVRIDGSKARMGISDYAQDALGDIVFVELPEVGRVVSAGETFAEVESTKSVSDVYAPVSGTIVEVNAALDDTPELVNSDPYGDGWFVVIEVSDVAELDNLMGVAAYEASTG